MLTRAPTLASQPMLSRPTSLPPLWGRGDDPVVLDTAPPFSFPDTSEFQSEEMDPSGFTFEGIAAPRQSAARPSDFSGFSVISDQPYAASVRGSGARTSDFSALSPTASSLHCKSDTTSARLSHTAQFSDDATRIFHQQRHSLDYTYNALNAVEYDTPRQSDFWYLTNQASSPDSNYLREKVFVVPVQGSETPLTQTNGSSTPIIQRKLSRAQDVQAVALRMYKVMREHGLVLEAQQAFENDGDASSATGLDEKEETVDLLGMDYLLKDGIVSYLRDVAKLTPPLPQQVVRFYDINYSAEIQPPSGYDTFGAKLFNCFFGLIAKPFRKKWKPQHLDILKGITGYIMPGSITLLLGPPGSGKSSLLKVLAGRAETNKITRLEGTVLFNNHNASDILLTRLIAYVNGQLNEHLPFLTVRETLEFAGDCLQSLKPEKFTPQMRRFFAQALVEGQDPYLEYILTVLGLKDIEHHLVGAGQNGITEDDRNRLTTAEIAIGTYSVMLYDQPCLGQESLATYELVSLLRAIGRFQQCSAVMSLIQTSPEVFDLFDRVILLGEGQILYQGPRHDVLHYFDRLGFEKPVHMDTADFLVEIAAGEGSQYLRPGHGNPNLDVLVTTYHLSDSHKDVMRIVHNEDVLHALWVESEPNLGLSLRKKSAKKRRKTRSMDNQTSQVSRSSSFHRNSNGGIEVIVSKLSSSEGSSSHGHRLRGIESSGKVEVDDRVTGISLPNGDMLYLNVCQSENGERSRASRIASLLSNARGHVRLQIERIREPETLEREEAKSEQFSSEYIQTWRESTMTMIKRQIRVNRRIWLMSALRLFQVLVMGLISGAVFYKVAGRYDTIRLASTRGIGFVTTANTMLVAMVQLPLFMSQRPTFYKQRHQRFFRVSSYIISQSIVGIPQALLEALVYSLTVYFLVGLDSGDKGPAIAGLFQFIILLFVLSCFSSILVLTLSGLSAILEQANSLAGLLVSLFLLFSGFMIFPSSMPKYLRWVAVINPLRWAQIAFCASVYERIYTDPCTEHVKDGIFYCANYPENTVGYAYLDHFEIKVGQHWYWISLAIIMGWIIIMHFLAYIVYKKIQHTSVSPSLPSQTKKEHHSTPPSIVTDEMYETPSRVSWTGFVAQGVDLREHFSNVDKSVYREMTGPEELALGSSDERGYDLESRNVVPESEEFYFSWTSSSLPVKPATLSFCNVGVLGQDPKSLKVKLELNKVSGYAKPGTMLALMGGNTSEKSTLLLCLANRGQQKNQSIGEILVNGYKLNAASYSRAVGFVERLDAHQPFLTVRESLMFSAALRLPREVQMEDRLLHVELILDLLELTVVADQLVGSLRDTSGKTFELAKKITIAVELAANPSILFLDEPTSGLDGIGERNIIHAIQIIAASGRTIIATIQHPTSRMLSAFSSVILLSTGGQQVYFGPVGPNCSHMLEYFESIPRVPKYDKKKNPVTHVLEILGFGINTRGPLYDFSEVYKHSSLAILNNEELTELRKRDKRTALELVTTEYAASFHTQAVQVFVRTQKFLWRNVGYTFGRIVSAIAVGLMLGLIYIQINDDETLPAQSRSLFIYIQVMLIGVVTANNVVPQLGTDRLAYFRERRAGMYSPILYPVSWAIAEIPYLLLGSLFFVGIGNGLAGVSTETASNFLRYWLALFVFTVAMAYFGMAVTLATPVPMLAAFIVSISTSSWITTSGVLVPLPIFRHKLEWTFWSDPFQYVINTLTAVSFYCDVNTPECLPCAGNPVLSTQPCPACNCSQLKDLGYMFTWTSLVSNRGVDYSRIPTDFAALSGMATLFAGLAFLAFVFFKHNKP